jgi:replicative DNA helicase
MIDLPHDTMSEAGITATLIKHPDFIAHSENLKPSFFYNKEHASYYWAIRELYKAGVSKIDAFNLTTKLNEEKGVKNIVNKSVDAIQEYINMSVDIARNTVEEYKLLVEKVIALSFKRDLYKKIITIENNCLNDDTDLNKLLNSVYSDLDNLIETYILDDNIQLFGDKIEELWNEIVSRRGNGFTGIPSKFPLLNNYFGYEDGELYILKARMKRGKSAFLMNEAIHKIQMGIPLAYFDTEMSSRLFFERLLSSLTKIPIKKIKFGNYSKSEEEMIKDAMKWLKQQKFVHIYNPSWTNEKIYSVCKTLKHKMNLQFLVFDYIKSNTKSANEQYNELGEKTDFLKNNIAGDLKIPVLSAVQLNRNGQIADSDKIERYTSVSMLWKEKEADEIVTDGQECGNYKLTVELNRIGEQMTEDEYIDFIFVGNTMTIEQAKKQHEKSSLPFE